MKPEKVEEKTKGGIYIPDEAKDKEQYAMVRGEIIDASPLAFTYETWPDETYKPKVGNMVSFPRYAGTLVKGKDGFDYRLINDHDVVGIYT